ncbi:hypothetical protein A3I28_03065 [Candidatus Giovannonibacteria bacterium RIFCSPLOWO2_02_FULL_43_37]|uniref:Uncharacterized protein n=1 Tax=Candidatus Giovannonibacteria bacterium RIFCSPLOWO2_12_FULL_43_26 TaxID=1798363 RepID=A0A1F5XXS6_9BACT|nr:MAG: hypothetical protein A3I28_03065 [Candidatus Giovannonibacteria bacterium RIFCSPLOWO2_02_FULL_43_37]OGF92686.1 MAG: hypothetical protein A3H05_03890 [Candidatus Giovannonibacteria bacterium RIFCSPLOWO2_12_FULL_43_26]
MAWDNGQSSALPVKILGKLTSLYLWSIYTITLEPILCEILDERKSLRPAALRRGSANGSRAKNFLPPTPSIFCRRRKFVFCKAKYAALQECVFSVAT